MMRLVVQRVAGDAGFGLGGEIGVDHRVADAVGDLVGVAVADRLRGEEIFAVQAHRKSSPWPPAKGPGCVAETGGEGKARRGFLEA
jgi:hypothetical protein